MLIDISPKEYQNFVQQEGNYPIIYVEMKKALCGMLQSSLLYYKKFEKTWKKKNSKSIFMIPVLQTGSLTENNILSNSMLMT
jgi:hypothetical protein